MAGSVDEREIAERVLTDRQFEIWQLRDRGLSQREIASKLGIATSTVSTTLFDANAKIVRELDWRVR